MTLTESIVEDAALTWFGELGHSCLGAEVARQKHIAYLVSLGPGVICFENQRVLSDSNSVLSENAAHFPSRAGRRVRDEGPRPPRMKAPPELQNPDLWRLRQRMRPQAAVRGICGIGFRRRRLPEAPNINTAFM